MKSIECLFKAAQKCKRLDVKRKNNMHELAWTIRLN